MKVAVIVPSLKKVGPVTVALDIVSGLLDRVEFTVFYVKKNYGVDFPCQAKPLTWLNFFELYKFDVIHSHMLRPDLIVAALPFFKGKKVSTIHNMVEDDIFYTHGKFISSIIAPIWVAVWKKFYRLAVLTEVAKRYYIDLGLVEEKICVVNNGVQLSNNIGDITEKDEIQINEFKKGRKILGSVCLFNHRKGLDQVIRALPMLRDFCFLVIGDGPIRRELEELASSLGVRERLLILGFRDNAKKFIEYFDVYVMPSRSEGFGLAMIEAVAFKKPVVCSNIGVFSSIFSDDEVSFFELESTESLEKAVLNALINADRFAENAYLKYSRCYTAKIMSNKYYKIYQLGGV